MTDHRQITFTRTPAMDIAVAAAHWSERRTKISANCVQQRLPKSQAACLIANQRSENIPFFQRKPHRNTERLLALASINAAVNLPGAVEAGQLVFQNSRQQHPPKCSHITIPLEGNIRGFSLAHSHVYHVGGKLCRFSTAGASK